MSTLRPALLVRGVIALLLLGALPARAEQPRFYLSTEGVFSPQAERIAVRLEARDLDWLQFRLYRIPDPKAFFLDQPDLHQLSTQNGPLRASSLDVAAELWRLALETTFDTSRSALTARARKAGRSAYGEQIDRWRQAAGEAAAPTAAMPLLEELELVDMWREDLQGDGPWIYRDVAVTTRRPGAYLVEAIRGQEVAYCAVIISRLVLVTRQSQDRFLVYAVDPELGTPVADARVELRRGEALVGKGSTDEDGLWSLDLPLTRQLTLVAQKGPHFALLDPSYHPANLFGRKAYLTTERPVYRPGQQVHFKGILRDYRDEHYRLAEVDAVRIEVRDPEGQLVHQAELPVSASGAFHGSFELFAEAALGNYRLLAEADEKQYGGEFKVKAYRKPQYQVRIETERAAYTSGEKVSGQVVADYYFGPPVAGAKVELEIYRTRFYIPWWIDDDYAWYYADAEYRNTARETLETRSGRLDAEGRMAFDFETLPDSQDYTYGIEAVVTDAADRPVTGSGAVRVTRARFRLVLEPEYLLNAPDRTARVQVITSDYGRRPVPAEVALRVTAQRGGEPVAAAAQPVLDRTLRTDDRGQAWLEFEPEGGGTYRIEARATDDQGNAVEAEKTLYVTAGGGDIPYAPPELEIVADRRSYRVGQQARFLLLTPHADAHLLATVEGGRLYRAEVLRARGHSAVLEVPIEPAQTPNFFVRVASVFDGALYERRLDVVVPPVERLLDVAVQTEPEQARPGRQVEFSVEVRDHRGEPVADAEVALAVVDEAIYGISPELAVPIDRFFYHRKRNDVRGGCSLDYRFYGYGQSRRDEMAALHLRPPVVPGSFKAAAAARLRTRFRDTLAFAPVLATDAQGRASLQLELPDNLTTWRATARVITRDTRVGQGVGRVQVSKPVVVRLARPNFLVERDRCRLGVLVHNYTDAAHTFAVNLEAGAGLQLAGEARQVEVQPQGVGTAVFAAEAQRAGPVKLTARAAAGDLGDGLEQTLPVRAYGMEQVLLAGGALDDERPRAEVELAVPETARPDSVRAAVRVSSGVAPALMASLEYLTGYPYGCTEQTMSRFLPDLVVAKALRELGLENEELEEKLPGYIHAGLARLAQLQHDDGGWGWWADDGTDAFMTAYVVHGLSLAKRLGWRIDGDMLERGVNRLDHLVRGRGRTPTERAYLLYALALAGVKYPSMLDKLVEREQSLTEYGRALLAMGLFELGRREQAAAVSGRLVQAAHTGAAAGTWWGPDRDRGGWATDPVETTAATLRSLLLTRPDSVHIPAAVRWLMAVRRGDRWRSTRDTAMAIFALVDYLKRAGGGRYDAELQARLNGRDADPVHFGPEDMLAPSVALLTDRRGRLGPNRLELERRGEGVLFYTAAVRFFGRGEQIPARGEALRIRRRLMRVVEEPTADGWRLQLAPLQGPVASGQALLVVLDIASERQVDYVLIEDPLPAGVQPIERDRGYRLPGIELRQPRLHREFHDQHAAFFIRRLPAGERRLAYLVRATLPGTYHQLPARVMPMYDPQLAGNSAGQTLTVEE
jgi:hypothetical protein